MDLCLFVAGDINQDATGSAGSVSCFDIHGDINIDPDLPNAAVRYYILDDNSSTEYPVSSDCVSVEGSSSSLTAYVTEVFDSLVWSVEVMGSGNLVMSANCPVGTIVATDQLGVVQSCTSCGELVETFSCRSKINIKCLDVNGSVWNIIDTYAGAKVQNVNVDGNIGNLIAGNLVQYVEADDIGTIHSLFGDVNTVVADSVDNIYAYRDVTKVEAHYVDEIMAGRDVTIIRADDLGDVIAARDAWEIRVAGDIDLISGASVRAVTAGDDVWSIKAVGNASDINIDGDLYGEIVAGNNVENVAVVGNINLISAAKDVKFVAGGSIDEIHAGRTAYRIAGQDGNGKDFDYDDPSFDHINVFAGYRAVDIDPDLDVLVSGDWDGDTDDGV
jgi:hypothetical protein